MLGYATERNQSLYIAIFWSIFNLGGALGGLLTWHVQSNWRLMVYLTVAMSCFSFLSFIFVAEPCTVEKEKSVFAAPTGRRGAERFSEEIRLAARVPVMPEMLLLLLAFIGTNWGYTYRTTFLNGGLFDTHAQGRNSFFYSLSTCLCVWLLVPILDRAEWKLKVRAALGLSTVVALCSAAWILAGHVQYKFAGGLDKDWPVTVDYIPLTLADNVHGTEPMVALILFGFADAALQAYLYWFMGHVAAFDYLKSARLCGFYKGVQSAGAAIAWGIDLSKYITHRLQFWIAVALYLLAIPLALIAALNLTPGKTSTQDNEGRTQYRVNAPQGKSPCKRADPLQQKYSLSTFYMN